MEKTLYDNIQQVEANHWWYKARREIIFDWVKNIIRAYPNPKVLDIGCGTGYNVAYLQQLGCENVTGFDFSADALEYCRSRNLTRLICGDASRIPLRSASYDVILTLDIIEHLKDDVGTLQEIHRTLKPGGTLVIFVPAYQFLWSLQDEISHHFRRYTSGELSKKVLQVGFHIEKLTYANTFLFPIVWAGRLALKLFRPYFKISSESQLNPSWTNDVLYRLFLAELPLLRSINFPFGVSILCICYKQAE